MLVNYNISNTSGQFAATEPLKTADFKSQEAAGKTLIVTPLWKVSGDYFVLTETNPTLIYQLLCDWEMNTSCIVSSQSIHLRFCWGAETISGLFTAVSSSSCSGGGGGVQHNIDKCNQRAGEVNETLKQSQFSHYLQDGCWLSGCSGMFLCFESEPV